MNESERANNEQQNQQNDDARISQDLSSDLKKMSSDDWQEVQVKVCD